MWTTDEESPVSRSPSSALKTVFFGWEGSPTNIDDRRKGTLILTSLLEDLGLFGMGGCPAGFIGESDHFWRGTRAYQ